MGIQLKKFYDEAFEIGRYRAKMRLAVLTLVPQSEAEFMPDTPATIAKFTSALEKIRLEFKKDAKPHSILKK